MNIDDVHKVVTEHRAESHEGFRLINGRLRTLEAFKAAALAVGGLAVLIAVNLGAWMALVG